MTSYGQKYRPLRVTAQLDLPEYCVLLHPSIYTLALESPANKHKAK